MKGKVFFVGGGPGALDLLTLRAVRVLQQADVVLHDELVPKEFPQLLSAGTTVLNVGERCGAHGMSQERVNSLLIRYALTMRNVVRLKGGDPSVFGRLGEEIDALRAAGISFEIVPGITAALAAAATAQVTLTDRRFASSVVLTTGSLANGKRNDCRAQLEANATLVIYMPGREYRSLAKELLQSGASSDLPCAVITRASASDEAVHTTTLSQLAECEARHQSPSIVIVGEVARLSISEHEPIFDGITCPLAMKSDVEVDVSMPS